MVGARIRASVEEVIVVGGCGVAVRVEEGVVVVLGAIVSIDYYAMFISSLLRSSILVGLFCFSKRVFAGFALRGADELGRSTARVGLEGTAGLWRRHAFIVSQADGLVG